MPLHLTGHVDLPANNGKGGFDHADVHAASDRLYVAHTSNDALDVIDCAGERYIDSVPGLSAVAGALVSEARGLVFTSNRGENTISMFTPGAVRDMFHVNIASPAKIVAIDPRNPRAVASELDIAAVGPHGLDIDPATGRLFCACDAGVLLAIDAASGRALGEVVLSGAPDVIFLQPITGRLYVAIGDPGVIDVIDTRQMRRVQTVATEAGAHTLALDRKRGKVFAFLPETHRAAVYRDDG